MRSVCFCAFLFVSVPLFAADPPSMKELSPAPVVQPKPDDPVPIDPDRYRVFSIDGYTGPTTWEVEGTSVGIKEVTKAFTLFGRIHGQPAPGEYDVPAGAVVVWGVDKGTTKLTAYGVVDGRAKRLLSKTFIVGESPRPPPKDDPIVPTPVSPSPFAADGLHVLIVFGGNEPESQKGIIYGQTVRSYLLAKCATGPDGKTKQARIWPATVDASGESKLWQDVFARPRKSVPWIVVGNGKAWEEGPLPATEAEALTLLKKYGG